MSATGDLAKAFMDSLPSLDHKKLLEEARRSFGIVLVGDEEATTEILRLLREPGKVPSDSKLVVWRFVPGNNPPVSAGKTELVIVVPAQEEYLKQARESFAGVHQMPIVLGDAAAPPDLPHPLRLPALDHDQVRKALVPALVTRLWDRRLALGRALPATRDRISWQLIQGAVRDTKVLLGSVAGAAAGRSGAPTPATAQLLVHQAALIAAIGAVYGADIEDKRALFARVTPHLTATLALDVAESQLSKLAKALPGGDKKGNLYATAAAVVARPTLSVTSTLVAGFAARRVFRGGAGEPSAIARAAAHTRDLGKRAAGGVGQSATAVASVLAARVRRREAEPAHEAASSAAPDPGPAPDQATTPDVVVGQADEQAEDRAS